MARWMSVENCFVSTSVALRAVREGWHMRKVMKKILATVVFVLLSHPVLGQAVPPYPDTSATGTVPDMSQKLARAKLELDKVEAEIVANQQKSDALNKIQTTRKDDAQKISAEASHLVEAWNDKVKAFNLSCGNRMQMHDPEWTDCFHWETELNDKKAEINKTISQSQEQFNAIKQEYERNVQQQLSYQRNIQDLNRWKSQTISGIQSLEAAILKKCKPLRNCPSP